jgi:hypothetical protein
MYIDILFSQMKINKPCNICGKKNNTNDKNICINCVKILTPHFSNCNCIYCK